MREGRAREREEASTAWATRRAETCDAQDCCGADPRSRRKALSELQWLQWRSPDVGDSTGRRSSACAGPSCLRGWRGGRGGGVSARGKQARGGAAGRDLSRISAASSAASLHAPQGKPAPQPSASGSLRGAAPSLVGGCGAWGTQACGGFAVGPGGLAWAGRTCSSTCPRTHRRTHRHRRPRSARRTPGLNPGRSPAACAIEKLYMQGRTVCPTHPLPGGVTTPGPITFCILCSRSSSSLIKSTMVFPRPSIWFSRAHDPPCLASCSGNGGLHSLRDGACGADQEGHCSATKPQGSSTSSFVSAAELAQSRRMTTNARDGGTSIPTDPHGQPPQ